MVSLECEKNEKGIALDLIIKEFRLSKMNNASTAEKYIDGAKINRVGLQLAGFFESFPDKRIQIVGRVEDKYMQSLPDDVLDEVICKLMKLDIPCVIFNRNIEPREQFIKYGDECNVPILKGEMSTSDFIIKFFNFFNIHFAPQIRTNGVLVDINGVGTLVRGKSGIGKSEAVLELIKRGHRFVSDDSVIITKNKDNELIGKSPELIKNLMEIRGIGIVDISKLYGIGSVMESTKIDFVVQFEEYCEDKEYDRLGLDDKYLELIGEKVPMITIPVKTGRNLAVILEASARNYSLKNMGFNAAKELNDKMRECREKKGTK